MTIDLLVAALAAFTPPAFEDPKPPTPVVLKAIAPPVARDDVDGLERIAAPRPRVKDAVGEDWPCFLGPRHNGHSRETGLTDDWAVTPPNLLWTIERGQGYACPAVAEDRLVYTHRVGNDVHVDCHDPESGARYWRRSFPCDYRGRYISDNGPRATPIIHRGRVYVHGVDGRLTCFELSTGRTIWEREVSKELGVPDNFFGVVASPIIYGDTLIQNVGAPGGPCVVAFDLETGRIVWGSGDEWGPSCASPIVAELRGRPRLVVMTGGESRPPTGGLMVLDPNDGAIEFTYPFRSRTYESVNGATPIVGGDRIFITASYNTGTAAIDAREDGTYAELWKTRRIGMQFSNPIFVGEHVYAIDGRSDRTGAIVCIDPTSGEELSRSDLAWEETLFYRDADKTLPQSIGEGSMIFAQGRALCLGDNGHLLWLDLTPDGATIHARTSLFRANESWSPPVLSNGLLYVCQNQRERFGRTPAPPRLLCFDLRAALLDG